MAPHGNGQGAEAATVNADTTKFLQSAKIPLPRHLGDTETIHSLDHWKTTFYNYYRRDAYFGGFLSSDASWNPDEVDFGFVRETEGVGRSPTDKAADLKAFLDLLASYLPHSYLTDRFKTSTRCIKDVWTTIAEIYGAEISSESLLDFSHLKKEHNETPRQFFEKLHCYISRHLTKADVKVEGFASGTGDVMTISMLNMVVITWLEKMDKRLVDMVKLEYATELRKGETLFALMPRIAKSVDYLLNKGDIVNAISINRINGDDSQSDEEAAAINKLNFKKKRFNKQEKRFIGRGWQATDLKNLQYRKLIFNPFNIKQ